MYLFLYLSQVHFLHEDVVVESVQKAVEEGLLGCNVSRTYYTQALLPTPVSLGGDEGGTERGRKGGGAGTQLSTLTIFSVTEMVVSCMHAYYSI